MTKKALVASTQAAGGTRRGGRDGARLAAPGAWGCDRGGKRREACPPAMGCPA